MKGKGCRLKIANQLMGNHFVRFDRIMGKKMNGSEQTTITHSSCSWIVQLSRVMLNRQYHCSLERLCTTCLNLAVYIHAVAANIGYGRQSMREAGVKIKTTNKT